MMHAIKLATWVFCAASPLAIANAPPIRDSATSATESTPGTVNPLPATSPLEGTAADRTPPEATPLQGTNASESQSSPVPGTVNPVPATSLFEGTAADRTPPGATAVRGTNAADAPPDITTRMSPAGPGFVAQYRASRLLGREVDDAAGHNYGTVRDILINDRGQVSAVVFASGAGANAGEMNDNNAVASTDGVRHAAPWSALQHLNDTGTLLVVPSVVQPVSTSQARSAPEGREGRALR